MQARTEIASRKSSYYCTDLPVFGVAVSAFKTSRDGQALEVAAQEQVSGFL